MAEWWNNLKKDFQEAKPQVARERQATLQIREDHAMAAKSKLGAIAAPPKLFRPPDGMWMTDTPPDPTVNEVHPGDVWMDPFAVADPLSVWDGRNWTRVRNDPNPKNPFDSPQPIVGQANKSEIDILIQIGLRENQGKAKLSEMDDGTIVVLYDYHGEFLTYPFKNEKIDVTKAKDFLDWLAMHSLIT